MSVDLALDLHVLVSKVQFVSTSDYVTDVGAIIYIFVWVSHIVTHVYVCRHTSSHIALMLLHLSIILIVTLVASSFMYTHSHTYIINTHGALNMRIVTAVRHIIRFKYTCRLKVH